jgi:glycerophosphoryl diester phosphodiesterase
MTKVYAHRGASIECPENTLLAFRRALELGVDGIELDVHLSKDGVAVVIHDETVDRTTNGTGAVGELTLAALKELDAGRGEAIPTLAKVLDLVGDQLHVNIEIKTAVAAEAVLREVRERPRLRWITSSFVWDSLAYVRQQEPGADVWPITFGSFEGSERAARWIESLDVPDARTAPARIRAAALPLERIIETAHSLGTSTLSIYWEALTASTLATIHDAGLQAWAWTVNNRADAQHLIALGVDAICTDDPAMVKGLVGE